MLPLHFAKKFLNVDSALEISIIKQLSVVEFSLCVRMSGTLARSVVALLTFNALIVISKKIIFLNFSGVFS